MSLTSLERFVTDRLSQRVRASSAVLEYTARERGLETERLSRVLVLVHLPDAALTFHGMNGPDSSEAGRVFRTIRDGQRSLLDARGIPVPRWAVFAPTQYKRAERFAAQLGGRVSVRPARLRVGGRGAASAGADEFRSLWRRAVGAYETTKGGPVLVEEEVTGQRLHVFVVDGAVVAATRFRGDDPAAVHRLISRESSMTGEAVDVTDEVDPRVAELAVDALRAVPGLPYGGVDLVMPTADANDAGPPRAVVTHLDPAPAPVAHFPVHGPPRDVAGAILDHYVTSPRWRTARETSHRALAIHSAAAAEPLHTGSFAPIRAGS
ncbi:hypothetical protein [Phytoactinopolyspora mesophila]|uniref:ATP-grasp domain-containing protein n=1 Tax=Phytoactinopolyspora mesophila TaxID=2650750 RepID=A0A7K3LWT9_9ACTN|nr:hypothetical protein [Phytoactinopolyspora mesophila]NDL55476.1 hypothetical protein [Phytoactinopolyspora mesophila]